ncbi:DUF3027 domain-containing protein [Streptomyces sp. 6N223]|uniref:DUF3027 domain-containing protein n=1 Tax=Streptomyces sp. 6N223 TaxID=3457412 RepID=UPI003FD31F2F
MSAATSAAMDAPANGSNGAADAALGAAVGDAAGGGRARRRAPDKLCAEAVDLARGVAEEAARPGPLGPYLGAVAEGDRLVTHLFASEEPGYRGWRWGVTVTRAARAKHVTIDEVALTPGPDALLAPRWVPWSERLRPGDLRPGDLLPAEFDDPRLEPGYAPPAGEETGEETEEEAREEEAAEPLRGTIAEVAGQLGLGRRRVLSWYGLQEAADRWQEGFGPETPMAHAAPASCVSCGFLVPMAGALRQAFGVCANEFSPADGHVVSLSYGCGAHSEAAESPKPEPPAPPVIDHLGADPL